MALKNKKSFFIFNSERKIKEEEIWMILSEDIFID